MASEPARPGSSSFVALIRGINVGTSTQISMPELKSIFISAGAVEVSTILRSGNVIFSCRNSTTELTDGVTDALATRFGRPVPMAVRSKADLADLIGADPLKSDVTDESRYVVGFACYPHMSGLGEDVLALNPDLAGPFGRSTVKDGHLFMWCPTGVSNAPGMARNWERHHSISVTFRNFRTLRKILIELR